MALRISSAEFPNALERHDDSLSEDRFRIVICVTLCRRQADEINSDDITCYVYFADSVGKDLFLHFRYSITLTKTRFFGRALLCCRLNARTQFATLKMVNKRKAFDLKGYWKIAQTKPQRCDNAECALDQWCGN